MKLELGNTLKELRLSKKLSIKQVEEKTGIDKSLITRFEKSNRTPNKTHINQLATLYKVSPKSLNVLLLSEKIYSLLEFEENALEALIVAENRVEYESKKKPVLINFKEVDELKKQLDNLRPLPKAQLLKLYEYYKIDYTFNSNKIEGNTLTLRETALVVEKGFTISGKSMHEHLEAINHAEAVDLITEFVDNKIEFNEYYLKQIHALVLRGIDKENAGKYRSINVRISGAEHIPPEPFMLTKLMEDYFIFYETNKSKLHPILLAAEMHERLVNIHPFIDGNGRTSRLVMNLILLQNGYTITSINAEKSNRLKYYQALEEAAINKDKQAFIEFVLNSVKNSLNEFLTIVI